MTNCMNIVIPEKIRKKAKGAGLNISQICRMAIEDAVKKLETKEPRGAAKLCDENGTQGANEPHLAR